MPIKIAICAIAKNEDLYIEEWIDHHLNEVGIDHIYVFDNNDELTPTIKKIKKNYSKVTVFDTNGDEYMDALGWQCGAYKIFYKEYWCEYDWIAFIDVDEFIETTRPLREILSEEIFEDADSVVINWRTYGDNDLVRYDSRPVQERFSVPAPDNCLIKYKWPENNHVKSIVRGNGKHTRFEPHVSFYNRSTTRHIDGFKVNPKKSFCPYSWHNGYLKHYFSKTIEEYVWRRIIFPNGKVKIKDEAEGKNWGDLEEKFNWFFTLNKHSSEKDAIYQKAINQTRQQK